MRDATLHELLDWSLRLTVAAVAGMAIGLNREMQSKPIGVRTLALVAMGAALVSVVGINFADLDRHPDALSRVIQGIYQGVLIGVGFIGAGVILRDAQGQDVQGLTTAATVWVTAAVGIACGLAAWHLVGLAVVLTLVILTLVKPFERWLHRRFDGR